jgi:hypothetical protein
LSELRVCASCISITIYACCCCGRNHNSNLSDRSRLIYETAAGYFSLNLENFDLSARSSSNYSPVGISNSITATFQPKECGNKELLLPGTDLFTTRDFAEKEKISAASFQSYAADTCLSEL